MPKRARNFGSALFISIEEDLEKESMPMLFKELIQDVPEYKRFFTVSEMDERSKALAEKYPDRVKIHCAGYSRKGEPIHVLQIGKGKHNALLFGCPHPNEPIGAMMLDALSELLAKDDPRLRDLDYTWYLIKVIDIDGTKLNEKWFADSSSIRKYAENFYRPAGYQQVEWTFPIEYKTLKFDKPLPETQVLMDLIREKKPIFMYSLHNSGFGGVYYYVSKDLGQGLFKDFQELPGLFKLPLNLGEPEAPFLKKLEPAIFQLFGMKEEYDYMEKHLPEGVDPATIIRAGTSSDDYASSVADAFSLVCEMPYYYDARVDDQTLLPETRQHYLKESLSHSKSRYEAMKQIYDLIAGEIKDKDSGFYHAIANYLETMPGSLQATENWIETDETLKKPASVAEMFDNTYATRFYESLSLGILRRFIDENIGMGGNKDILEKAKKKADELFEATIEFLEKNLRYHAIPIKDLVCVQMLAGLNTMAVLQQKE